MFHFFVLIKLFLYFSKKAQMYQTIDLILNLILYHFVNNNF